MKFRKKNSIVTAERFVYACQHPLVGQTDSGWRILTPDGWREVKVGDWIVTDSTGAAWPMPHSVFENLFEPYEVD
ncbi:hypothetical protein H0X91_33575 [Burkholderia sp. 9777_1386]|uniref:hypothetical protein n=1 Tax=Burkholderia sp. 9777_1386 TaxID=2751183 RepID=UPI0018C3748E|nr:hypothetical protein [Burkholderia sp. 9777_1386]MBG0874911.1 hypothetical protein [Burkholderia sp. 9777_1386]